MRNRSVYLSSVLILCFFLAGCGYSVRETSGLDIREIHLGYVMNMTTEPGLQDTFRRVFTEECLNQGIPLNGHGITINVILTKYKLRTVTVKNDLSAEYSVDIIANVEVIHPDGKTKSLKNLKSEFLETFVAPESVQAIHTRREVTTETALRDLSRRIIAEVIYGQSGWDSGNSTKR